MEKGVVFRLALFDPCGDEMPEFVGPVFANSEFGRFAMRLVIERYYTKIVPANDLPYCLAPFPYPWESAHNSAPASALDMPT